MRVSRIVLQITSGLRHCTRPVKGILLIDIGPAGVLSETDAIYAVRDLGETRQPTRSTSEDQESMSISNPLLVREAPWTPPSAPMTTSWGYVHRAIAADLRSCDVSRCQKPTPLGPVNDAPSQRSPGHASSVNGFVQAARRRQRTTSKSCLGRARQNSRSPYRE